MGTSSKTSTRKQRDPADICGSATPIAATVAPADAVSLIHDRRAARHVRRDQSDTAPLSWRS